MNNLGESLPANIESIASLGLEERAEMAAALLESLEPGRQPLELFKQLSRITVTATVEVVPIRTVNELPEIWLDKRSASDSWWPNKWALPGVVVLPTDAQDHENTLAGPVKRLFESELRGVRQLGGLNQLPSQFRFDGRGNEVVTQYWTHVVASEEPYEGRFFTMDDLTNPDVKDTILQESSLTINRAVADYYEKGAHSK